MDGGVYFYATGGHSQLLSCSSEGELEKIGGKGFFKKKNVCVQNPVLGQVICRNYKNRPLLPKGEIRIHPVFGSQNSWAMYFALYSAFLYGSGKRANTDVYSVFRRLFLGDYRHNTTHPISPVKNDS